MTMVMNINFVKIRVARPFLGNIETSFSMINRGMFAGLSSISVRFLFHVGTLLIKTRTSRCEFLRDITTYKVFERRSIANIFEKYSIH